MVTKLCSNPSFFDRMTRESAYFLGLLVTDGGFHVSYGKWMISLALKSRDGDIVRILNELVGGSGAYHRSKSDTVVFATRDQAIASGIAKWGILIERKTYHLDECATLFSAAKRASVLSHLIRGMIDGDGHVTIRLKPYTPVIGICGREPLIRAIQSEINSALGIEAGSVGLSQPGLHRLTYGGSHLCLQIGSWLYQYSEGLRLERKRSKFLEIKPVVRSNRINPDRP
jgi:hypothetical protein